MEVLTFDGRYVLWSMSERGHKNISLYHMTVYFKDLVDGYNQDCAGDGIGLSHWYGARAAW